MEFILKTFTSLLILFTKPDRTLPGPISINSLTPLLIMYSTLSLHLTLEVICLINNSLILLILFSAFAVTLDIIDGFGFLNIDYVIF